MKRKYLYILTIVLIAIIISSKSTSSVYQNQFAPLLNYNYFSIIEQRSSLIDNTFEGLDNWSETKKATKVYYNQVNQSLSIVDLSSIYLDENKNGSLNDNKLKSDSDDTGTVLTIENTSTKLEIGYKYEESLSWKSDNLVLAINDNEWILKLYQEEEIIIYRGTKEYRLKMEKVLDEWQYSLIYYEDSLCYYYDEVSLRVFNKKLNTIDLSICKYSADDIKTMMYVLLESFA